MLTLFGEWHLPHRGTIFPPQAVESGQILLELELNMSWQDVLHLSLVALYLGTLGILTIYGFHRYAQVLLYMRHCRQRPEPAGKMTTLPRVTVQLPMYNEQFVAARVIEASCAIDYPRELLQIQILDDSTDGSAEIARETCARMCRLGHDVEYVHRTNRHGYKAGALAHGMKSATGEYIAIFDADFVPPADILVRSLDHFTDPNVGCVQTRWDHLNRDQSLLTQAQAIFLDGHFMIEHTARNRSGRFINFNGTAGIWRRTSIEDAGGWAHDTLTEDMDLSYRAQLRGWRFVFLSDLLSPAELPPEVVAFKQQQHRWTKGSVQVARKLLGTIMRAKLPLKVKAEAFFHLTATAVYIPAVVLSLILFPTFAPISPNVAKSICELSPSTLGPWIAFMSICGLLTCSAGTFYVLSQKAIGGSVIKSTLMIPLLMALGTGISVMNGLAVLEGLFGRRDTEFVRTPKYGSGKTAKGEWKKRAGAFRKRSTWLPFIELSLGGYMFACIFIAIYKEWALGTIPFLFIFGFGYTYVGLLSLQSVWASWRISKNPATTETTTAVAA
jgi:cellulose synthase/poly-beta-1,6-N-acetylglucosamine synthase-like glycosyltransferase